MMMMKIQACIGHSKPIQSGRYALVGSLASAQFPSYRPGQTDTTSRYASSGSFPLVSATSNRYNKPIRSKIGITLDLTVEIISNHRQMKANICGYLVVKFHKDPTAGTS
ncbi:unnamed protein product [Cochlearia groenlandica]